MDERPYTCRENEEKLARVTAIVEQNQGELKKLNTAVLTGNGHPSILARVEVLEKSDASIRKLLWGILITVLTELVHSLSKGVHL